LFPIPRTRLYTGLSLCMPCVWLSPVFRHRAGRVRTYTIMRYTVTGQLADTPTRGLPNRRLDISWTGHLADWSTHALVNSRTGQLAVSQMPPKERKLSTQSHRWHPGVVQSATCPVRELSSLRVDQSARCPVHESSSTRVGSPRLGVSASCPVTHYTQG